VRVKVSLTQSHAEPPTLPIHIRVVANVFVVKDERTASTKERSCSSTNLVNEKELLVVIPSKLSVALWMKGNNTHKRKRERRVGEIMRWEKKKKKGQDGIQLFFFCFNLIITQARARATQNTRVFH